MDHLYGWSFVCVYEGNLGKTKLPWCHFCFLWVFFCYFGLVSRVIAHPALPELGVLTSVVIMSSFALGESMMLDCPSDF